MPLKSRLSRRDPALTKLIFATGLGITGAFLLFVLPALFFIEQNYELFIRLAYDTQPGLVHHLEREVTWLRFFLCAGTVMSIGVSVFFVRRVFRSILEPIENLDRHLAAISGGSWQLEPPQIPSEDHYQGLFLTYDHFHRSLIQQFEVEKKLLEDLNIDPADKKSFTAWTHLLDASRERLGLPQTSEPIGSGESSAAADSLHRAS